MTTKQLTWETAIREAYQWARSNRNTSVYASAAYEYIAAFHANRLEGVAQGRSQNEADRIQLLYIMNNLQPWRGELARECKVVLKKRIKELGG